VNAKLDRVICEGNNHLLERLLANLLDNAIRHNRPAGWITISTTSTPGTATLTVANSGAEIAPHDVDRLTQPFQRLAADRTGRRDGHGLGLSIVAAITAAHHGSLRLQAQGGGGLRIGVMLPVRPTTPQPHPAHEPNALLATKPTP
jgi:signal transduction histidine kinase